MYGANRINTVLLESGSYRTHSTCSMNGELVADLGISYLMTTELSKQLAQHRAKYVIPGGVHEGRPSLFLSPSEAAATEVSEILEAAQKHMSILAQYDARIGLFSDSLFHNSTVGLQRETKTEEVFILQT